MAAPLAAELYRTAPSTQTSNDCLATQERTGHPRKTVGARPVSNAPDHERVALASRRLHARARVQVAPHSPTPVSQIPKRASGAYGLRQPGRGRSLRGDGVAPAFQPTGHPDGR